MGGNTYADKTEQPFALPKKKNTITQDHIKRMLDGAKVEEHVFHGNKELNVSYQLDNGFTITERAAVVDPANFDLATGRRIARKRAEDQLWLLEGYRLQCDLYRERILTTPSDDEELDEPLGERTCSIDGEVCESCQ